MKKNSWKSKSEFERLQKIGRAVVITDEIEAIQSFLGRALKLVHTGHQGSFHPLMGDTNVGKTTAQRLFMTDYAKTHGGRFEGVPGLTPTPSGVAGAEYVSIYGPEGRTRPIVRIEIGKNPTFNSLLNDVFFCLTGTRMVSGSNFALYMQSIAQQLTNQKIQLLIFDDVQHVSISKGKVSSKSHQASEVFKVLAKVLNAEMVLSGLPNGVRAVVEENAQTVPLALNQVEVGAIEYPMTTEDRFCEFLDILSTHLPFDDACPIQELELAQRIHSYSKGAIGDVKSLMRAATLFALENGLEIVNQTVLAQTFDAYILKTKGRKKNPFRGPLPPPPGTPMEEAS